MRRMDERFSAARGESTGSTFPSIGCRKAPHTPMKRQNKRTRAGWMSDFQQRVGNRQVPHSLHSDAEKPPYPHYYDKNRIVRKENACGGPHGERICGFRQAVRQPAARGGRHSMSEYAPSDRLTASIACKDFSFRVPLIWMCPPQERAFALWQADFRRRVW